MCGIVGCIVKNKEVAPVLLEAVRKLEYRGYDSVGIATLNNNDGIDVKKGAGKIDEVDSNLHLDELEGNVGIAHVRWATHGEPNKINAHPHLDCHDNIAIVHNGIIKNYSEIKARLIREGHEFKSATDSEVIAHLLEHFTSTGMDFEHAMIETLAKIEGSYAIAAIFNGDKNKIIAVAKKSPLVVGIGDKGNFIASDVPAFLKYTNKVIFPEDNEIITLEKDSVTIKDLDNNVLDKEIHIINWTEEMAEKGGFGHFMIKEIHEQANVVKDTLSGIEDIEKIAKNVGDINRICFVACGTSYHAALTGKYLFEGYAQIPTDVVLASEFKYSAKSLDNKTLVIFISQSGETADTLSALELVKGTSKTIAIVNVLGSKATRIADHVIYTKAGPEIGVAATKTYMSQLVSIYLLSAFLARDKINNTEFYNELLEKLEKVPKFIENILNNEDKIKEIAIKYKYPTNFFFLGRGLSYPTALEGALKLKEITYIHAEGYASGELKHGPLALIDYCVPVLVLAPKGDSYYHTLTNMAEVQARGADVILLCSEDENTEDLNVSDLFTIDREVDELIAPLVYIVPLQMLSYYVSVYRGLDPDKPRNLAKCVTVE
ncbi:glutamine--fructose-6-phosphate transaminase (isomerizing) [Methanobrevibacter filiformis]|uniref:Glutamine--fructose-6-phosphate aminotransferase [isomerizing] n=1 Tax=Methanobrevibacter filiformis TaxID=55758 RepID=A0A166DA67_9EURY|nr:glutamine--fructose-6-phosphate transaminase (isomerizing) [Methanobrevibacter filiformis]KZX15368.1 glutamine--fructose-6-phosphate aminotransferase [Methanobrevibacter filiformis]